MNTTQISIIKEKWYNYPALFICSFFLLMPALYNHYPFVNPDTATYLASGFIPETPFDRPITYGLLARLFSLNGFSLWLVVFAQAYIVSWLIFKIVKGVVKDKRYIPIAAATIVALSLTTSLSWLVCQVQPDVFTSVGYLCVIAILLDYGRAANRIVFYILFFISVAVHMSHPLLFAGSLFCLLLLKRLFTEKGSPQPSRKILTLIFLSITAIGIMGAALSKSKHVFFTASLLAKGVTQQYLADNCALKGYKICAYRTELTTNADYFMWNPESPLYKIGGWQDAKPELNAMIHDILTTPEYQLLYAKATMHQAVDQALAINIGGGNESFDTASNVGKRIAGYFPGELSQFDQAKQNSAGLQTFFVACNKFFAFIVMLSIAVVLYHLNIKRRH